MSNIHKFLRYLGLGLLLNMISVQFAPTSVNSSTFGECVKETAIPANNKFKIDDVSLDSEFALNGTDGNSKLLPAEQGQAFHETRSS